MNKAKIVLMYHGIVDSDTHVPPQREVGADLYDVTVGEFEQHLRCIQEKGLAVKKIEEASEEDVVITFDDGELNNYRKAYPSLKKFDFPAYFFIITKRIGKPGYMGLEELKKLSAAGMMIGSHGMTHEILTKLKDTQVYEELTASKKYLERNLDIKVTDFSVPRGYCNDKIIEMAHDAGYKNIFISERPKDLTRRECYSRVAVKCSWTQKRLNQALEAHVPVKERFVVGVKNATKAVFKESGYNWIRNTFIRMFK